jgi:hypothetical protein
MSSLDNFIHDGLDSSLVGILMLNRSIILIINISIIPMRNDV